MSSLLETKEIIKNIYSKNEVYFNPVLKFLLAFAVFLVINGKTGYMERIDNIVIVLVAALFCSFMPLKTMAVLAGAIMLLHYYALAPECALVVFVLFLLMFLLYIRFVPKETVVVLLTPVLFFLKIPYVMPVAMGLVGGPASIISVTFGVIISSFAEYTELNAAMLSSMDTETIVARLRFVVDGLLGNKTMIVTIAAFAITLLIVYVIRRMSIDHAWTIAIITGSLTDILILVVADFFLDLNESILWILVGSLVAGVACKCLQFFSFHLDYSRTENVQFEDDEYYYYVKAVPKITVAAPDRKVKKITSKREEIPRAVHAPTTVKTSHGVARTSQDAHGSKSGQARP